MVSPCVEYLFTVTVQSLRGLVNCHNLEFSAFVCYASRELPLHCHNISAIVSRTVGYT